MPMTAGDIINDRVRVTLIDRDGVRWSDEELMSYLNDGINETVRLMPRSYSTSRSVPLVSGTLQSLPEDGITFIDIIANSDADGNPGRAIRMIDRGILDVENPDWHLATGVSVVKHAMFDDRNPQQFMVHPPSDGTGHVRLTMSIEPPVITSLEDVIPLESTWTPVLVNYVLHRAYAKDAEYASNGNLSTGYYEAYLKQLGYYEQGDIKAFSRSRSHSVTQHKNAAMDQTNRG